MHLAGKFMLGYSAHMFRYSKDMFTLKKKRSAYTDQLNARLEDSDSK